MLVCKYAPTQVCKYASINILKYVSMQVCSHARMKKCKYADEGIYGNLIVLSGFIQICMPYAAMHVCACFYNI